MERILTPHRCHRRQRRNRGCGGMPLSMVCPGTVVQVQTIQGRDDTRQFLKTLGFVEGTDVCVVCRLGGNVIINVKDSRIAISRAMAARVLAKQDQKTE